MSVQIVGSYTFWSELDQDCFVELFSNAETDNEAIASAVAAVADGTSPRVHVRSQGRYLAEVRKGWRDIIIEKHDEDGTVSEFSVPCLMWLVTNWLDIRS